MEVYLFRQLSYKLSMATLKNISHLKHGTTFPDPHATAKAQGKHFSTAAKHVERHETPDSSRPDDGHLADDADDHGPMLHRPMDAVTKAHTCTGSGGSKRD
jgi:hypothetical protein